MYFKGALFHADTDGNTNETVFSDVNSNSILTILTPQAYEINIVGHSSTVYYISGFVAGDTPVTFTDA